MGLPLPFRALLRGTNRTGLTAAYACDKILSIDSENEIIQHMETENEKRSLVLAFRYISFMVDLFTCGHADPGRFQQCGPEPDAEGTAGKN